jgi:hypothetical protein
MNLIYYAILVPLLIKLPQIQTIQHQPQIANMYPYYHHCQHYNAASTDLQNIRRHPPGCWMNYTTPIWQPSYQHITIPQKITLSSNPRYLENRFIFRTTRFPPLER